MQSSEAGSAEEKLRRGLEEQGLFFGFAQKMGAVLDQGYGGWVVGLGIVHGDRSSAVAFPHTAVGSVGFDHLLDEREQIQIGRLSGAEALEGADFHHDFFVSGKAQQRFEILRSIVGFCNPDVAEVVEDDRGLGKSVADPVQSRQEIDLE